METITCGEATIRLLEKYGVDTVFGIPGVHTLEFYRGLASSPIQHIQARHEGGAGFMADGYARSTGKPGVCLLISGPGVTNGLTPLGQSFADSIPILMLSSTTASYSLKKGWGTLHEVTDLEAMTAPVTAFSATAMRPEDVPELLGQAFRVFASERPRPVHIAIPLDVLGLPVDDEWAVRPSPQRPLPNPADVDHAAKLLMTAERPLIFIGGGAIDAGQSVSTIAETLGASIISSNAGKGIVPESHPLNIGGGIWRPSVQAHLAESDCVLAIGTELSETDSYVERLDIQGKLIRVDIDPAKINDLYPADLGIVADAAATAKALLNSLQTHGARSTSQNTADIVQTVIAAQFEALSENETQHVRLLNLLREALPENAIIMGDMSQLIYTGSYAMPVDHPRLWHYPAGFCTLGCALPNAIGAKLANPESPVIAIAGDGGIMFSIQELITAAELGLNLPILIWDNGGYNQIKDDMLAREMRPIGVAGRNPDFVALAGSMGCHGLQIKSEAAFRQAINQAFQADRPTVLVVKQGSDWLRE